MSVERHPGSISRLPDDILGTVAVSLVVSEVQWTPDVAPAVLDRISRDAVTYPEQFDRRPKAPTLPREHGEGERSSRRMIGRLAVFVAILAIVILAAVLAFGTRDAEAAATDLDAVSIELVPYATGLDEPVFVTGDGTGATYVVEQAGVIRRLDPGGGAGSEVVLDIREGVVSGGEYGLLGIAFHPAFPDDPRLFVDYTRQPDGSTVVSEFIVRDGLADPSSERELLTVEQPAGNHNGGMIAFDAGGYLLIGMGDGGGAGDPLEAGQDRSMLLGKLLRIDVDAGDPYAIPPGNGFGDVVGDRPEIFAAGLRNPWRFSVDPIDGHIYIGDVGQGRWEEVNVVTFGVGGANFGWNEMEGPDCFRGGCDPSAFTGPAIAYDHGLGCSIAGGAVYRGTAQASLEGIYLFGDFCSGRIWGADAAAMIEGPTDAKELLRMSGSLVSFGTDDEGEIYAVDIDGRILHIREVTG